MKKAMVFGLVIAARKPRRKKIDVAARRRHGRTLAGAAPGLDAEPDQIGGADPAQIFEDRRRMLDDDAQAECDAGNQNCVADGTAYDGDQRRPRSARRTGRDDERHDRTGDDDQHEGDEQEGGEEVEVHFTRHSGARPSGREFRNPYSAAPDGFRVCSLRSRPGMTETNLPLPRRAARPTPRARPRRC